MTGGSNLQYFAAASGKFLFFPTLTKEKFTLLTQFHKFDSDYIRAVQICMKKIKM